MAVTKKGKHAFERQRKAVANSWFRRETKRSGQCFGGLWMAYSKIKNVWTYFRNLDGALQAGCIDDPKAVHDFVEVDEDDGQIVGWIIPHRRVHFSQGSELSCTEEGVPAKAGQFHIPEYHFHFQYKHL